MPDLNPTMAPSDSPDQISVPLIEETATVGKREVITGKVIVRTLVDVEDHLLRESLSDESVEVERFAIDRVVDVAPQIRTEGDVTIIPVVQERIVVQKVLILLEEVHITRRKSIETVDIPLQLRTQRAVIERT
ncbi:YsnF/AvaK domain-containing protein [uncultured Enterovirga sp.]|uniref:YsnF/AvaK domain-containing protein n=1 Tax=uncultured Enterovirga sp. TaxID=2026352 RepID=UPI0035C96191